MNSKRFEYTTKDIPYLKRDIFFRALFAGLLIAVFLWQFIAIIYKTATSSITIMQIASSILVILCSLLLAFISFMYAFKDFRIISAIKLNGRCVSAVQMLIRTTKRSFIKLYSYLLEFLALITSLVLICSIVYAILEATYLSTTSFYMPLLFMICISGFNSIYHIKDEIHTQNHVQEFYNA